MDTNKFIKENLNWNEKERGTFDFNGIKSVLDDYIKEIEKEHLEKTKIRVHGESLEEDKLEELIRPILKHLCNNYHPHVTLIINPTKFELLEGLKTSGYIYDYVRD